MTSILVVIQNILYSFKSNVSKRYSIFSFKNVKIKVIYNNLLKGQATIFF